MRLVIEMGDRAIFEWGATGWERAAIFCRGENIEYHLTNAEVHRSVKF